MTRRRCTVLLSLLAAGGIAGPALADPGSERVDAAIAALAEFSSACERVEPIWTVALCGPLVLVDPSSKVAIANQPDPDGRFVPRDGAYVGTWPEGMLVANTAVDWGGTTWAMALLPLASDAFPRLRLLAHESFHRIQPALGFQIDDPLARHLDEEEGRVWLRLELRAYARALATGEGASRDAARDGLLFRRVRHALFPEAADVERRLEAHEGLAEYTGTRFAVDATGADAATVAAALAAFERRPTYVRSLGYGTGPALGLLLDAHVPAWRRDATGTPDMAAALAAALSGDDAVPGASRTLAEARAQDYGVDAVRVEESGRAQRIAAERARHRGALVEGPVLALELPERMLMFNPNTVLALGDAGNVYPGAILVGPWGRLTLREGAALATPERDRAWVAASSIEGADTQQVTGPGWTLALEPGWRVVPGGREGDYRLQRQGD